MSGKHHLSPAKREEMAHLCYELSLEGCSTRDIAARPEVQLSKTTVSTLIFEEAKRRRAAREDARTKSEAARWKAMRRIWAELNNNPSAHAAAQLMHALRGFLSDSDLVTGVRAPTKSETKHQVDITVQLSAALPQLSDDELQLCLWLWTKGATKDPHLQSLNVVALAFKKFQRDGRLYEEYPIDEIVEGIDYDSKLRALEAGVQGR